MRDQIPIRIILQGDLSLNALTSSNEVGIYSIRLDSIGQASII